jgi:hypothetical protein
MFKLVLTDLTTNEIFGEFPLCATAMFQVSKAIRTRYGCDEDMLACINDSDYGSDVTVYGQTVARIDCVQIDKPRIESREQFDVLPHL